MRRHNQIGRWIGAAGLALSISNVGMAQRGGSGSVPAPDPMTGLPRVQSGPGGQSQLGADEAVRDRTIRIAAEQEKVRNDDRQKRLVADTQKLLALATELKADVDKTDRNTLSVDVVKKADEIEKLAHSVKEKMKGG